jgi:hypothetical protein
VVGRGLRRLGRLRSAPGIVEREEDVGEVACVTWGCRVHCHRGAAGGAPRQASAQPRTRTLTGFDGAAAKGYAGLSTSTRSANLRPRAVGLKRYA